MAASSEPPRLLFDVGLVALTLLLDVGIPPVEVERLGQKGRRRKIPLYIIETHPDFFSGENSLIATDLLSPFSRRTSSFGSKNVVN